MQVSLPMYDLPELLDDHQRFWDGLRRRLRVEGFTDLPVTLAWPEDLGPAWRAPDLLLSQTCGYPLVRELAGHVQLVGIPHYDAPGCQGYDYSSALIVAGDSPFRSLRDLRGTVAGFNERGSQSGYNALRHAVAPLAGGRPFFSAVKETGRHEASIDAVAAGTVDIAAIDAVTFALIGRYQPGRVAALRVIGFTDRIAGLPLVTSISASASERAALRRALQAVFADPSLNDTRARLLLTGCSFPSESVYQAIAAQEEASAKLGYPVLA
jgi:ABC-type phosphate/phosphonate transport system substrate-binding protein